MRQRGLEEHFFFKSSHSDAELPSALASLAADTRSAIRVGVVLSEANVVKQLQSLSPALGFDVQLVTATDEVTAAAVKKKVGRKAVRTVSGRVYVQRHPRIGLAWLVISGESAEFDSLVLHRALKTLRPRCTKPLLRTQQIEEVLTQVSRVAGVTGPRLSAGKRGSVSGPRILQVGSRSRIRSSQAGRAIEVDRRWTDVTIPEAFRDARESEQWITDATMAYWWRGQRSTLKVTRRGQIVLMGAFAPVFWTAVDGVSSNAAERYRFLSNRNRSEANEFVSRPFAIEFSHPVFGNEEAVGQFRNVISAIGNTNCTVLHANPYFHAVLVDYGDGSTYEALIIDPGRVTVIPQGRATARALQRFCVKVFSSFREGEFKEVAL